MEIFSRFIVKHASTGITIASYKQHIHYDIYKMRSATYLNDLRHGVSYTWYRNKQLRQKKNYLDGELNGVRYIWYRNGQLQYENNYLNGELHGIQRYWYSSGKLQYEYCHAHGQYVDTTLN